MQTQPLSKAQIYLASVLLQSRCYHFHRRYIAGKTLCASILNQNTFILFTKGQEHEYITATLNHVIAICTDTDVTLQMVTSMLKICVRMLIVFLKNTQVNP